MFRKWFGERLLCLSTNALIDVDTIMSTIVTVTVMLTLPWIMLGEPPANDHKRYSVVSPSMFTPVKLSMKIPRPVDQIDRRSQEFDDIGTTHPIDNKYSSNQSEIYKYDHFSMHTELLESKKNASTDIKYSIHDVINNDLEEIKNQTEENGWTLVFRPEQALISKLTSSDMSESISGLSKPSFKIEVLSPPSKIPDNTLEPSDRQNKFPGLNHYRIPGYFDYYGTGPIEFNGLQSELVLDDQPAPQPPAQPAPQPPAQPAPQPPAQPPAQPAPQPPAQPSSPPAVIPEEPIIIIPELPNILNEQIPTPSSQPQMTEMNKINWQRVSILLALIQLVLFKLKLVGFIKILLFFLFKLKLLLILVFFKFISIFNILLFYKLFLLPLLLLPLLPILLSLISPTFMVELLSIPKNMINMVLGPAYFGNTTLASTRTTETISYTSPITNSLDSFKTSSMPRSVTKTLSLFKVPKND